MRRLLAMVLACLLCLPGALGEGMQISLQALSSELMSAGALRALNGIMENLALTVISEENSAYAALHSGETALLQAYAGGETAVIGVQDMAAPLALSYVKAEKMPDAALETAKKLGELLLDWEKTGAATAELGDAGKPKMQAVYALTNEEWALVWPQVCDALLPVLSETMEDPALYAQTEAFLQSLTFKSKCTLRRYFAADGTEMGAYFYAAEVQFAENDTREVRLEYGYTPGKGFYLTFRCPNKKETRNVRLSIKGKTSVKNARTTYTLTADVRSVYDGEGDTYLAESSLRSENGRLSGSAEMNITEKRKSGTVKSSVTVKPDLSLSAGLPEGTAAFSWARGGMTVLEGTLVLQPVQQMMPDMPLINAESTDMQHALAKTVLLLLRQADDADRQELLHYLAQENYLEGETTTLIPNATSDLP